ncbi:MAG TPA: hypothetical protein VKK79_07690, partial [Candidatus Lokiarchaeia archaeon]|nr:hypothetical protein [Candidatus Lokiarchaeia archaeon]
MTKALSNVGKLLIFTACVVVLLGTCAFSAMNSNQTAERNNHTRSDANGTTTPSPRPQTITSTDNNSGVGLSLPAVEYANTTNTSQQLGPFDMTSSGKAFVNIPPQWNGYQLFTNVTN